MSTLTLPDRPNAARSFRFEIPFVKSISKNRVFFAGMGQGHPIMKRRGSADKVQSAIALVVSAKVGNVPWPKQKTWLDIIVQKPNHRSDALNVIDTLADGIKEGIGIDDRWFSISLLDWEIVKENPMILVQVSF